MWEGILDRMLRGLMKIGRLDVTFPDGSVRHYGQAQATADRIVRVTIHDETLPRRICLNADLGLGEGYVDGGLTIEDDDIYGLLELATVNAARPDQPAWRDLDLRLRRLRRGLQQYAPKTTARKNVSHHYDLSGELYDLFLDEDKQYSCAYFRSPDDTLEEAQAQKKKHIAEKLRIEPGMRILDIGCGWGGMGLTLARDYGATVLGVTLSTEQQKVAAARAKAAGLEDRVEFRLTDYREVTGAFDRIVSVGMFEHVGVPQYETYFRKVYDLLDTDGIALIHTIGRTAPPGGTSPWIQKYIFPGGYVPALSEVAKAVESTPLWTTDVEIWRLHYAETLRHWYERFMANADRAEELYDARFVRMWRYYLIASELGFREHRQCVFQVQLARRKDAVPLTRDYLYRDDAQTDVAAMAAAAE
ncbi:cyclopropane-fatty-acyl-phospholipid synthase family protein [Tropicimonas sp. IMCC34011]|uniref:SAM-dependent methyltransferase n=1 Tax=Tropicimonas sp. IMCC34011 TaxID=2248759 RepID=UPI000E27B096|nr:cyclopropane-fatty-acyl-phospholipid synthase family protein [Tropicimonas sp. IMCC34011]